MPSYLYVPLIDERKFLIFGMDASSGKLRLSRQIRLSARPYQLCADPGQRYLYQQLRSESYSAVASFRIDPASGDVTQIGEVELEADACYVVTDLSGRFLLAAYLIAGMVTVHPIGDDGAVRGPASDQRITEIYAHSILTDPSNRYAFVPHVAPTDSIHQFRFDAGSGKLRPGQVPRIATTPGHGPRHLAFHPAGRVVYANEEQSSSLGAYRLDPSSGGLTLLQSLSTLPREGLPGQEQYRIGPGPSRGKGRLRFQPRSQQHCRLCRRCRHRTAFAAGLGPQPADSSTPGHYQGRSLLFCR